jgi:phosphoribosylformimino-5-aminoimidazole carboxamide ribotide isomerase
MPSFEVIPVVDLMGGLVVHARAGERDRYRPLESPLAASSEPADVVRGLLALHPFRSLYIADLDAIQGRGDHIAAVRSLKAAFPEVAFWVDAAFCGECSCRRFLGGGIGRLVLGSESQSGAHLLERLGGDPGLVLSLDFRGDARLGPAELFDRPELWPERLIVMTLAAVGGGGGPDYARLGEVLAAAGDRKVYAAGGVRGAADLERLAEIGCAGVLVASALHDGRIKAAELARFG